MIKKPKEQHDIRSIQGYIEKHKERKLMKQGIIEEKEIDLNDSKEIDNKFYNVTSTQDSKTIDEIWTETLLVYEFVWIVRDIKILKYKLTLEENKDKDMQIELVKQLKDKRRQYRRYLDTLIDRGFLPDPYKFENELYENNEVNNNKQ